jgi:DNA polymerase III delta prime subunit
VPNGLMLEHRTVLMRTTENSSFLSLLDEFSSSYLPAARGEERIRSYLNSAEQLRQSFREVTDAAGRGDDVTELVLTGLLSKASRRFIESAGWIQPRDMRRAMAAILQFIRRCNHHPEQLDDACAEFAAVPFIKGIQAGMLTPILNALRPAEFALFNNRTRTVLRHFTGKIFSPSIAEYPRANDAIHELIRATGNELVRMVQRNDLTPVQLFDLFAEWLVSERKYFKRERPKDSHPHYWKLSPGEIPGQWEESRRGGFIAMQGEEIGDISTMTRREFNQRRDVLVAADQRWTRAMLNQLWRFAHIATGDRIIVNDGTRNILGTGSVSGNYYYEQESRYSHRLPVKWDENPPSKLHRHGWRRTLMELEKEVYDQAVEDQPDEETDVTSIAEPGAPYQRDVYDDRPEKQLAYSLEDCADDTGFDVETTGGWIRAIERKGQAIFYGPPGTGKTYIATRLARHLVGGGDGFVDIVQFHPAYAYEDFVQGIRPQPGPAGVLEYPLVPGRFLQFCERAAKRTGTCVMVIDEINRANLPRVFGELMYLLEYRDQEVTLAGGRRFRIPANVRIIGTMNTADRSIALVDHALRRRFAFLELRPDYTVLERYHQLHNPSFDVRGLIDVLKEINRAIADRHYELGISYFLRPEIAGQIEEIWRTEIEGYLDEYFFDQSEKAEMFQWGMVGGRVEGKQ